MRKLGRNCARFFCLAALVTLAACGSPSATSNTAALSNTTMNYPVGIAPFKNETQAIKSGLYPSKTSQNCCFIAQHAKLVLDKPAGLLLVRFRFYVPKKAPFEAGETVSVSADGSTVSGTNVPSKWIGVSLLLPERDANKTQVPVDIVANKTFVPEKIGLSADTRQLSVVLTAVDYR